jgi:hypothetical protein
MAPGTFAKMSEDKVGTSARAEIQKVASPTVQAKQAIGVFDFWKRWLGSGVLDSASWTNAFDKYLDEYPVRPIAAERRSYFAFSGERPPEGTFNSLRSDQIVLETSIFN